MKISVNISNSVVKAMICVALLSSIFISTSAHAAPAPIETDTTSPQPSASGNGYTVYECSGGGLTIPNCVKADEKSPTPVDPNSSSNPILAWLAFFLNLFAVIILVGGTVMLAVAGVQYTVARDNAQAVAAAKQRIISIIVGLLMYLFFYSFMQWLIPGGIF